jgi:hypothetical protein
MELEYYLDIVRVINGAHVDFLADDAQIMYLRIFIQLLFTSKVVKIIHIPPVLQLRDI